MKRGTAFDSPVSGKLSVADIRVVAPKSIENPAPREPRFRGSVSRSSIKNIPVTWPGAYAARLFIFAITVLKKMGKVNNSKKISRSCLSSSGSYFLGMMFLLYFSGLYSAAPPLPAQPLSANRQMALEWKYATGGRVLALTAAHSSSPEIVHLLSEDRRLYSLRADGILLRRSPRLKSRPQPFLQRSPDGTLYSILEPGNLAALNPSGRLIWKLQTADSSPPVQWLFQGHSGLLYTLSEQNISLYTHTGQIIWQEPATLQPDSSPAIDPSGSIWIFSREGELLRIDASGISLRVPVVKGLSQTVGSKPSV